MSPIQRRGVLLVLALCLLVASAPSAQIPGKTGLINPDGSDVRLAAANFSKKHYISVGTSEDEFLVAAAPAVLHTVITRNSDTAVPLVFLRCSDVASTASNNPASTAVAYEQPIPYPGSFSPPIDQTFTAGIVCWIVTGEAETDVAEVTANKVSVTLQYALIP